MRDQLIDRERRVDGLGRRLVALLVLLSTLSSPLSTAPLRAATLTGTFVNRDGSPYSGAVRFRPKPNATVLLSDGTLGVGGDYDFTTSTNGVLTATVVAGIYYVFPGVTQQFTVDVPDNTNTYTLTSRITNSLAAYVSGIGAAVAVPLASDTVAGKVKTDAYDADPVVYLSSSVDALFVGLDRTNEFTGILDVTDGTIRNTDFNSGIGIWDDSGHLNLQSVDPDKLEFLNSVALNVATVAAMRSLHTTATLNDGQVIITAARSVAGDCGGAAYVWTSASTTTTNLGTVFDRSTGGAGRFSALETGTVNARQFKATGDGVTDDTAALDSARDWAQNAARTSGVSTVLYLPRGNYLHSGNFTVAGQIKLKGDGLETSGAGNGTTIVCTGDNTPAVAVGGQGFGIEDIEFRYQTFQDSTKTNSVALKFVSDTYKYAIRNVAVRAGYDGIGAAQSVNVYNGTADNVFVRSYAHSGVRMLSGGTVNTWNNLYIQNLANVQSAQTATITNVTLTAGTNLVFQCSGTLPPLLATNRQFVVTGLDTAYNANYFVRAISGFDVYCDAASALSAPSDITGTLTFYPQPATGYPIELGNGEHTFIGLDVEHVVTDAAAIIYAPSLSYVHIVDAHLEAVYRSSGGLYLVHSPNGSVTVDSLSFINSGFNVGSANYTFRNETAVSSLIGGNVTARDIAFAGATWYSGSAGTGADYPMVDSVKAATAYRANATGTPTGDGSLRFRLGGGNKATGSSGTETIFSFSPTVSQSGSARYYAWEINPVVTSLGSGTSYPFLVSENGTNFLRASNRGSLILSADTAQNAEFGLRDNLGDKVAISYGSTVNRKLTLAANSIDVLVHSNSAAASLSLNPSGGAVITGGVIELGHATANTLSASGGVLSIEGVVLPNKNETHPTTAALSYSTTNVTLTAGGRATYSHRLVVTNNFQFTISGAVDGDNGLVGFIPATTNVSFLLASPAFSQSGQTLTITAAGSTTNHATLAWRCWSPDGSTNRVDVTLGSYYR